MSVVMSCSGDEFDQRDNILAGNLLGYVQMRDSQPRCNYGLKRPHELAKEPDSTITVFEHFHGCLDDGFMHLQPIGRALAHAGFDREARPELASRKVDEV